jgi:hypothetical protein
VSEERRPEDIEVVTAIEAIRRRPLMYFGAPRPRMAELISRVARDAALPPAKVEIQREGDFALVCADVDWMPAKDGSIEYLFTSFNDPARRQATFFRGEILIAAVAECFVAIGEPAFASGMTLTDAPAVLRERAERAARALIWKFRDTP